MSANLKAVPPLPVRVENGFAQIFGAIDRLENLEAVAAQLAPDATDKQLIDGRVYAVQLGKTAWKIVVIFDAEIWKRTKRLVGGRGNKDDDEKGIMKAVDKQAHELGCGGSTIRKNAQLYTTFETVLSGEQSLEEKAYYQAALASKEPLKAIERFADERSKNPFFRPADAWRIVNKENKPTPIDKARMPPKLLKMHEKAVRDHLEATITMVRKRNETPPDPLLNSVYLKVVEILEWQRDRDIETDCMAIMKIFTAEEGAESPESVSDDYIAAWLNSHGWIMGDAELDARLDLLVRLRMVRMQSREGSRGPTQRGSIPIVYAADDGYADMLDRVSVNPRAPERLLAIRKDWIERLTRYAPELLPKEKAA